MTLLPILILAAGLNGGVSSPPPASHAEQAQARLNQMVAAATPVLHRRAADRAVTAGSQRLAADIARELSHTRVAPAEKTALQARSSLATPIAEPVPVLQSGQLKLLPPLTPAAKIGHETAGSSAETTSNGPHTGLSATLLGGLLTGFLTLAGLAATAFTRWTS